jgi:hypothetical protein
MTPLARELLTILRDACDQMLRVAADADAQPKGPPKSPTRKQKRLPRRVWMDESIVDGAQPRAGTYTIWDIKRRGLALRVQPTGSRSWYFVYGLANRTVWLRIADARTIGLAEARELAGKAAVDVTRKKFELRAARALRPRAPVGTNQQALPL